MSEIYDVIIIGNGPAGLSAGIYAMRAGLRALLLSGENIPGGRITETSRVDNYPGLPEVGGMELGEAMKAHLDTYKIEEKPLRAIAIENGGDRVKRVVTSEGAFDTRAVIIATGVTAAKLNVPGEEEFSGLGVSYCASCDGAFYADLEVAVVGGGDTALEEAMFLSRICKKVYLIHRRDAFRAAKVVQDAAFSNPRIEVIKDTVVKEIRGTEAVEELLLLDVKTSAERTLAVEGIFIAAGNVPNISFEGAPDRDASGFILAGEDCNTSIPGIFAAGDIRTKKLRQVITAAADGAVAATEAERYISSN